jgi:hypothetical protein
MPTTPTKFTLVMGDLESAEEEFSGHQVCVFARSQEFPETCSRAAWIQALVEYGPVNRPWILFTDDRMPLEALQEAVARELIKEQDVTTYVITRVGNVLPGPCLVFDNS